MTQRSWVLQTAIVAAMAVAACGGTAGPTSPGSTSVDGGGGGTPGPVATASGGGVGGGAGLDDPCSLLTTDEVSGALGTDPLTASGTPGDPARCLYALADGEEALDFDLYRDGAAGFFQTFVDAGSGESVDGLGDEALYEPSSRRLLVRTGDYLIMLFSRLDGLERSSAMARIIVARLTTGSVPPEIQITAPPVIAAETACDLLSADEAASVIGKGPMEAQGSEFSPQFCTYAVTSTGEVVVSTFLQASGGAAAWDSYSAASEPVSGLGDRAMFEATTGILFVLKGDAMFNVNVFLPNPADALDPDRQLAEVMLGHL